MVVLLTELWRDFWNRTVLFPPELFLLLTLILLLQLPLVRRLFRSRRALAIARPFRRFANQRRLAVTAVFLITIIGHFVLEPGYTAPAPGLHDEYSYLLAGDTFAQGRLTNPPHPVGFFLESFHILIEPTYMSMYPPGQGLALALGTVVAGHPIAGVWISVAAACAALTWMLQGWVPPHWALLGGLLAVARIGWFSYWGNSYWGGAVAMLGGALIFGAVPRLVREPSRALALWLAAGILLGINTRQFEGVLVTLFALGWLGWRLWKQPAVGKRYRATLATVGLVLLVGGCWMMYYNWRITGDALRTPYSLNRERYGIQKWLLGSKPDTSLTYKHEVIANFYRTEELNFVRMPHWQIQLTKLTNLWWFFVGPALTLPLLGLWGGWRSRSLLVPAGILAALLGGSLIVVWTMLPHYAAPAACGFYLLLISGFRRLRTWNRLGKFSGAPLARAAWITCCVMVLARAAAPSMGVPVFGEATTPWYSYGYLSNAPRQTIERKLTEMGGKHLVLVEYSPTHSPHVEWVYNRASIDDAAVVWSRTTADPMGMAQLLQYFRDRRVWVVYPDVNPMQLYPYKRNL